MANGGNATQAALACYDTNYQTARVIGYENLTKPHIRAEIDRLMADADLKVEDALKTIHLAMHTASNAKGGAGLDYAPAGLRDDAEVGGRLPYPGGRRSRRMCRRNGSCSEMSRLPLPVLEFMSETGEPQYSEAQFDWLTGDHGSWEQAVADGVEGWSREAVEELLRKLRRQAPILVEATPDS